MMAFSFRLVILAFVLSASALAVTPPQQLPAPADSGGIGFRPGPVKNFLVEIIWPREGQEAVYADRSFEVRIIPRDRFLNPTDTTLRIRLASRFSGEFDKVTQGFFEFDLDIQGPTSFIMTSNTERSVRDEGQWIMVYCVDSLQISGKSSDFSVLSHAPFASQLRTPANGSALKVYVEPPRGEEFVFSWQANDPADPYHDMRSPEGDSLRISDEVTYTCVFTNPERNRFLRLPADEEGHAAALTLTDRLILSNFLEPFFPSGSSNAHLLWGVESSDGTYTTASDPEWRSFELYFQGISLDARHPAAASEMDLRQNYPNPFNPSTTISFVLPQRSQAKLSVHDNLGREIAVLADEEFAPGSHTVTFNGAGLTSGTYTYRLEVGDDVLTRQMLLLK